MSELKFRPRFKIETALTPEEAESRIKLRFNSPHNFESSFVKGHYILRIPANRRRYWSPQMDISVYYDDYSETTQVRCLMAPAPAVWTMFMFFYGFAGFGVLFGLIIGSSQYTLQKHPWGFWMAAICFVVMAVLFVIAQFGKRISRPEMQEFRNFIDGVNLD